jgi:hypothetical protein
VNFKIFLPAYFRDHVWNRWGTTPIIYRRALHIRLMICEPSSGSVL